MSEEVKAERSLIKCRECGETKVRISDGKYPDKKNTRWVDEQGRLFNGKLCPSCQTEKAKAKMKELRFRKAIKAEVGSDEQT